MTNRIACVAAMSLVNVLITTTLRAEMITGICASPSNDCVNLTWQTTPGLLYAVQSHATLNGLAAAIPPCFMEALSY